VIRRRRTARLAREKWYSGPTSVVARAINSQAGMSAITPRVDRIINLVGLTRGRRYLDIGCGTAAFAHLIAARAGLEEPPYTLDITSVPGPVDAVAWPEHLPLPDASFDAITCLYFIRRFDDDVVHGFGGELARILAPGGTALVLEVAPVENPLLNRLHSKILGAGCGQVDLRGWGRLAALFTESGFDALDLVNVGPFLVPPIPRVGVLMRRAPAPSSNGAGHAEEALTGMPPGGPV
jgi:SAM-dependent methyltransferase